MGLCPRVPRLVTHSFQALRAQWGVAYNSTTTDDHLPCKISENLTSYCWWLKSKSTHLGWCWSPINNGINYQPQLVSLPDFSHQQYESIYTNHFLTSILPLRALWCARIKKAESSGGFDADACCGGFPGCGGGEWFKGSQDRVFWEAKTGGEQLGFQKSILCGTWQKQRRKGDVDVDVGFALVGNDNAL